MPHTKHVMPELNSGSMADIAFLLLTFYMMTTVIQENKGLTLLLPPLVEAPLTEPVHARNLFTIHINAQDKVMVEGKELGSLFNLRKEVQKFILNYGQNENWSDNPIKAVVSIKTDRGTSYHTFIDALDEAQAAYYNIYADRAHMTSTAFRTLDLSKADHKKIYNQARNGIPMNISIAEPSSARVP